MGIDFCNFLLFPALNTKDTRHTYISSEILIVEKEFLFCETIAKKLEKDENASFIDKKGGSSIPLKVQEKLLGITDLKLEKAVEICRAKEALKEKFKTMHEEKAIEKIEKKDRRHRPQECPAFGKSCNRCGKLNHFEVACRVKKIQQVEDLEEEEMLAIESVNIVKSEVQEICVSAWFQNVELENKVIKFKLDTGAQVNILPEKIFNSFNSKNTQLEKTNIILEDKQGKNYRL
ncbi:hypothetical protein ALC62_12262 [Cyphomyrmex costatus]|uniref:Peptidase A2 domain-containing protein n=1 Tax=Cyphomyrmex costatus TaxID=456900 RepID=A0A151IBQ6_9HYME|nr:hypothetical protein ALC62_12262 [Cyphomyrmex costatus]